MAEHCNGCHSDCQTCDEHELNGCPTCGKQGIEVNFETVKSISKPFISQQLDVYREKQFYLCISKACKIGYYTSGEAKIPLNQLNVPVWFKKDKEEYIVCYCRRITLDAINEAIDCVEVPTRQAIIKYLNRQDVETDCLHNNPTGKCCTQLFENAIKYLIKKKSLSNEK